MNEALQDAATRAAELISLKQRLAAINERLWQIEDHIRAKEAASVFDRQFIELARRSTATTTSAPRSSARSTSC